MFESGILREPEVLVGKARALAAAFITVIAKMVAAKLCHLF